MVEKKGEAIREGVCDVPCGTSIVTSFAAPLPLQGRWRQQVRINRIFATRGRGSAAIDVGLGRRNNELLGRSGVGRCP